MFVLNSNCCYLLCTGRLPQDNETAMAYPRVKRAFLVLMLLVAFLTIVLVGHVGNHDIDYVLKRSMLNFSANTPKPHSSQLSVVTMATDINTTVNSKSQIQGKNMSLQFESNESLSPAGKTLTSNLNTFTVKDSETTLKHERPHNLPTSGYIMIIAFYEQLESAVWDIYQILCLAVKWNMKLVEPFLKDTHFGVPQPKPRETLVRFGDLYNMTAVNDQLRECLHSNYPPIASYEEFATQSYAGVWLLDIMRVNVPECSTMTKQRQENRLIERRINALSSKVLHSKINQTVHISKVLCVDARKVINFRDLPYSLGIPIPKPHIPDTSLDEEAEVTKSKQLHTQQPVGILFRHWSGIRNKRDKFYYHDPDFQTPSCPLIHTLEHSEMVKTAAQLLFTHFNLHRPLLGLHIRLERLIITEKPGAIQECAGKLMRTLKALKLKYSLKDGQVLAFRDYGMLGSQTCKKKNCTGIAAQLQLDAQLKALGVQLADYDPTVLRIPNHIGLASTVEKELISTSDYLLTVGWGSFQRSVRDRILKNHPEDGTERLYSLCSQTHDENLPNLTVGVN